MRMATMHLYELSKQYADTKSWLESDEIIDEVLLRQKFAETSDQLKIKAENIGKMVLEYESDVATLDNEISRLSARKKSLATKTDWLKSYLLEQMQNAQIDKIPCDILTISLRKNPPSVIVLNPDEVEQKFRRIIPETYEIDKKSILENFKISGEIPVGCDIKTDKKSIVIK